MHFLDSLIECWFPSSTKGIFAMMITWPHLSLCLFIILLSHFSSCVIKKIILCVKASINLQKSNQPFFPTDWTKEYLSWVRRVKTTMGKQRLCPQWRGFGWHRWTSWTICWMRYAWVLYLYEFDVTIHPLVAVLFLNSTGGYFVFSSCFLKIYNGCQKCLMFSVFCISHLNKSWSGSFIWIPNFEWIQFVVKVFISISAARVLQGWWKHR